MIDIGKGIEHAQFYISAPVPLPDFYAYPVEVERDTRLELFLVVKGENGAGTQSGIEPDQGTVQPGEADGGHQNDVPTAHRHFGLRQFVVTVKVAFLPENAFGIGLDAYAHHLGEAVEVFGIEMAGVAEVVLFVAGKMGGKGFGGRIGAADGGMEGQRLEQHVSPAQTEGVPALRRQRPENGHSHT